MGFLAALEDFDGQAARSYVICREKSLADMAKKVATNANGHDALAEARSKNAAYLAGDRWRSFVGCLGSYHSGIRCPVHKLLGGRLEAGIALHPWHKDCMATSCGRKHNHWDLEAASSAVPEVVRRDSNRWDVVGSVGLIEVHLAGEEAGVECGEGVGVRQERCGLAQEGVAGA